MSEINSVKELLFQIKKELENQIALANKDNQINMGKIIELASSMPNKLVKTNIHDETKTTLLQFANRTWASQTSIDNLKMHLGDVNTILSKLG